ncbi:HK97 gp10 family phage protein [Salmonella enterica]
MSFTLDVKAFCEKAKKNPEIVMRQVSIKLFRAIILGSPVDTGRFRNNWFAAMGPNPSMETTNYTGKEGTAAINRMTRVVGESRGMGWTELTLTNNLPYATVIEFGGYPSGFTGPARPDASGLASFVGPQKLSGFVGPKRQREQKTINGFSKQAPQGVVRVNIARFNTLLNEEAAKVK